MLGAPSTEAVPSASPQLPLSLKRLLLSSLIITPILVLGWRLLSHASWGPSAHSPSSVDTLYSEAHIWVCNKPPLIFCALLMDKYQIQARFATKLAFNEELSLNHWNQGKPLSQPAMHSLKSQGVQVRSSQFIQGEGQI